MTELDYAKKQYDDKAAEIIMKVDESISLINSKKTLTDRFNSDDLADIMNNYWTYHIHEMKIMSVNKATEDKPASMQIMFTFEDNQQMFIYVDIK